MKLFGPAPLKLCLLTTGHFTGLQCCLPPPPSSPSWAACPPPYPTPPPFPSCPCILPLPRLPVLSCSRLQAQQVAKAVRSLPRSLAQWLPPTGQHPNPPPSRLAHVLLRHFPPPHPAGQHPHERSESASSNPRIAPYAASTLPTTQQQVQTRQLEPRQQQGGGRRAARAAAALLRGSAVGGAVSGAPVGPKHPAWVAVREGVGAPVCRLPLDEQRPQSAGSHAAPAAMGKPAAAKGRKQGRARSVSPNGQYYQFSCTSSVPEHGSSCCGDAASVALQDWSGVGTGKSDLGKRKVDLGKGKGKNNVGIGRQAAQRFAQLSSWQPEEGNSPVHTTYVLPHQHDMLPRCMPEAREVPHSPGHRSEQNAVSRHHQQQQQVCRDENGSYMQQPSVSARLRSSPGGSTRSELMLHAASRA